MLQLLVDSGGAYRMYLDSCAKRDLRVPLNNGMGFQCLF